MARDATLDSIHATTILHPVSFLDTLETTESVQELNCQELECGLRSETCPDWKESSPKRRDALAFHSLRQAIHKAIVNLLVCRLVHNQRSQSIGRGAAKQKERRRGQVSQSDKQYIVPTLQLPLSSGVCMCDPTYTVHVMKKPAIDALQKAVRGSLRVQPVASTT